MAAQFESLGVMPEIVKALEQDLGWDLPRDIQEEAVPTILGGADVMAAAETGSGKTGAFALPLVQVVYETLREVSSDKAQPKEVNPRMNIDDREAGLTMNDTGLLCQSRNEKQWAGARGCFGVIKGKYYYEVTCRDAGLSRVGWSLASATFNLGTDNKGYGFGGTGKRSHGNQFDAYGMAFGKGNTVGCYIDCDQGKIHWSVDGKEFNPIPIQNNSIGSAWYPAIVLKNAEVELNMGDTPFKFPPQNGYIGLKSALPDCTTIKALGKLTSGRPPLALILEPSRELAQQTHEALKSFMKYLPPPQIRASLVVGGIDNSTLIKELKEGVDIVTGTIGRVEDLLGRDLSFKNIRFFVLDEADQMMEPDNFKSIQKFYSLIPKSDKPLQVLMFSATLHSEEIKKMSEQICKFPQIIDLKGKPTVPENVDHVILKIDPTKDDSLLKSITKKIQTDGVHARDRKHPGDKEALSENIKILKAEYLCRIIEKYHMDQALIFVRTKLDGDNLHTYFRSKDQGSMLGTFSSSVLHGGKGQKEREQSLDLFKKGEVRFLIATDVAARGIHIEGLPYVINYTLPAKPEIYVHRIGRTGRSDKIGLAISLVGVNEEKVWYHTCPSRGANCSNTKLVPEGGCTIWLDESQILKDIEGLISQPVPLLNADLSLPQTADLKQYGGAKAGKEDETVYFHKHLRPVVEDLVKLEESAQRSFWSLQLKFNRKNKAK